MVSVWRFCPELSYRWKNSIPDKILEAQYSMNESELVSLIEKKYSRYYTQNHDCRFYISEMDYRLKKAYYGKDIDSYARKFAKEFDRMSNIHSPFFPQYYSKNSSYKTNPYVVMDYFPTDQFITLETYLRQSGVRYNIYAFSPKRLISNDLLKRLLEQLNEALLLLIDNNILYLDLQPDNILINPATGDLRLIDFTGCYDLSISEAQSFCIPDRKVNPKSPPAVNLTRVFGLLIARLHYPGEIPYGDFSHDWPKFRRIYNHMFDDLLIIDKYDPMRESYEISPEFKSKSNVAAMYKARYESFMDDLNHGRY